MRLSEVLQRVEGLNKRFVYYLEAQGHIRPTKLRKQRISRRDYGTADLQIIKDTWSYYRRGFSVQNAYEMATRVDQALVYVWFKVPARRWTETLDLLRAEDRVSSAAIVYGESSDLIASLRAPEEQDIYAVLNQVFDRSGIASLPRICRVRTHYRRCPAGLASGDPGERSPLSRSVGEAGGATGDPGEQGPLSRVVGEASDAPGERRPLSPSVGEGVGGEGMRAYVLIRVPAKHIERVVEHLREFEGVVEASALYGETDILAKLEVPSQDSLDDLVMRRIQDIPEVDSTRTFICVGGMHWSR